MRTKKSSLHVTMLLMTVLPIIILGLLITAFSSGRFAAAMQSEVRSEIQGVKIAVMEIYDKLYPGDFSAAGAVEGGSSVPYVQKGDYLLNGDFGVIDRIKEKTGMDVTFFYGDTRIITTIRNENGERIVGTRAGEAVVRDVLNAGREHFYSNVVVNGEGFFAYYYPLFNSDGECAGMLFIAKPSDKVRGLLQKAVMPNVLLAAVAILVFGCVSFLFSKKLIDRIHEVENFVGKAAEGDLTVELPHTITDKNDEIGEMGRHIIHMQTALRELVDQDMLTGLYNRRCGEKKLLQAQWNALSAGHPFAVAIGDIDSFKQINDTYGHECGDLALKNIAGLMLRHMEDKGFAARWGGEEFLFVYDNMDGKTAAGELRRLLCEIREERINYQGQEIRLTMSFGVVGGGPGDVDLLLKQADDKMYSGKLKGKDQVVV